MSEVIKGLQERRARVWEEAKELADRSANENRAFTGEEESKWVSLNAELDALDKRMQDIIDGEQRAKDTEEKFATLRGMPATNPPGKELRQQSNDDLRAFFRGERGREIELRTEGPIDFRDLLKTPVTAGGNTVPTDFFRRLVEHLVEVSGVLRAGPFVLNTGAGENIQVPKTTAHSTAVIVGEGLAIPESDPTFGQITLGSFKYGNLNQVSRELITDTGVDLEGYLARQTGRAIGNALGNHLVNGTGTGQPRGVITDATVGKAGAVAVVGAFNSDDLIDLFFSVIEPYRLSSSCVWLMRDATLAQARKLKLADGQYIWQPGLQADTPDLLLGKRVITDPFVPAVGLGAKSVVFGDFSQYFVRTVNGIRYERSDDFAFANDLVSFRGLYRADGALVDLTGALKVFQGGAT